MVARARRAAWATAGALVAAAATLVGGTPPPAGAAFELVLSETVVEAAYQDGAFGGEDIGDVPMPQCNSENIEGRRGYARWTMTSTLGDGSIIFPGREWDVSIQMYADYVHFGDQWAYNDGPHPLVVRLQPYGPVEKVSHQAVLPYQNLQAYNGDGSVGPISPSLAWGYSFDSNSSPKLDGLVAETSDGVDLLFKLRVRATKPGVITLPQLLVTGQDGSPLDGNIECAINLNWEWTVIPSDVPMVLGESVRTDATYVADVIGDRQDGFHGITIDVLANDDDLNVAGGPGNPDQVRLASWSVNSVAGGSVDCGPGTQNAANFADLSDGPCLYYPPDGFAGLDSFTYTVRQATHAKERVGKVTINVVRNARPVAPALTGRYVPNVGVTNLNVGQSVSDPDGDPVSCGLLSQPATIGTVTLATNCTGTFAAAGPTGSESFQYLACDTHPLVTDHGGATRVLNYNDGVFGDLSPTAGRRCIEREYMLVVTSDPALAPIAVADFDIVDANYAGESGPYSVQIPVLANDYDINDPDPSVADVLDGPDPTEGTADVIDPNDEIRFTPAPGFEGPVSFTYRSCEFNANPLLALCGVGVVNIDVRGNAAPDLEDDLIEVAATDVVTDWDVSINDAEPDGEALGCTSLGPPSDAALVDTAVLSPDCLLSVDPADDATGSVSFEYTACDDHTLANPSHPATPYGADGAAAGDPAPRCATAVATVVFLEQEPPQQPENPDIPPGEPDEYAADPTTTTPTTSSVPGSGSTTTLPGGGNGDGGNGDGAGGASSSVAPATLTPQLPSTGSTTWRTALIGAATLALGVVALISTRRRRPGLPH